MSIQFGGLWRSTITYEQGDVVVYNGGGTDTVYYRSLQNTNLGKIPKVNPTYWEAITLGGNSGTLTVVFGSGPDADRLEINGVVQGPHLTGPQGDQGNGLPLGTTHSGQIGSFDADTAAWVLSSAEVMADGEIQVYDSATKKYMPELFVKDHACMSVRGEAVDQSIEKANSPTLVVCTGTATAIKQGFSFKAGVAAAALSFADYGGTVLGTVKCTTVAPHDFDDGDIVAITGTTNYDGVYTITKIDNDEFYFSDTWVANDATGTLVRGDSLTLDTGRPGIYEVTLDIAFSATTGKTLQFSVLLNSGSFTSVINTISNGDSQHASMTSLANITANMILSVSVENLTDTTDVLVESFNVTVKQV